MKRINPIKATINNILVIGFTFLMSLPVKASIDEQYSIQNVGVMRPWDNIDGIFASDLKKSFEAYFSRQTRFTLRDISQADAILSKSKIPYYELIEDKDVINSLGRSLKVESLLRTKIYKEGKRYRFIIEFVFVPKLEILSSEQFYISDPEPGKSLELTTISTALTTGLDSLFSKIPFIGEVTGRDRDWVTLNCAHYVDIKKGDELTVASLKEIKKHPLLKKVVEWRMEDVARLVVEQIDQGTIFAKIVEEYPGKELARFQKLTRVIPAVYNESNPRSRLKDKLKGQYGPLDEESLEEIEDKKFSPPRMGWFAPGIWLGPYSRENSTLNGTEGKTGGGFLYGVILNGELWINRNLYFDLGYRYGLFSYSQQNIQTGLSSSSAEANGHAQQFNINLGYSYLVTGEFFGPKVNFDLGFKSTFYTLPASESEQTGDSSMKGVFIGLGGDVPVRDGYGVEVSLDLGVIKNFTESGYVSGNQTGLTDISFYIGGYYHYSMRNRFRFGLEVTSQVADFGGSANLSQRVISFGPSLQLYF